MTSDLVMEWVLLVSVIVGTALTVLMLVDGWRDLVTVVRSRQNGTLLRVAWGSVRAEGVRLVQMLAYGYIALELMRVSFVDPSWRRTTLIGAFTLAVVLEALKQLAARRDRHRIVEVNGREEP